MMDGKTRHNRIEVAEIGQWLVKVVLDHLHVPVTLKSLASCREHGGRKVDRNATRARAVQAD
jgi:hypothetical protein